MTISFHQRRVLVVHNSAYMRAVIADMVHAFGFKDVVEVAHSASAFEKLGRDKIDLVIAQHEEDAPVSVQLTAMVRKSKDNLDYSLPIILISLSSDRDVLNQAYNCGADAVLAVPIVAKAFYSTICALFKHEPSQVQSSHYAGPNRRNSDNRPTHQNERRLSEILALYGGSDDFHPRSRNGRS